MSPLLFSGGSSGQGVIPDRRSKSASVKAQNRLDSDTDSIVWMREDIYRHFYMFFCISAPEDCFRALFYLRGEILC